MIRRLYKNYLHTGSDRTLIVKKNVLGSIAIKGCSIIIQLMLVPLTLDYLSPELYGIWLTLSSVVMWINFFDVGFTLGLKNKLTEAIALGDFKRGKALVSTTYFMMIVIFAPLCIVIELLLPLINWSSFLNIAPAYNEQLIQVMQVLTMCFCLQMIFNVISSVLAAYQKVALSSVLPVIGNFFAIIVIYLLTKFSEPSLLGLALAISYLPIAVYFISSIIFFKGNLKAIRPSIRAINTKLIKEIFALGVRFFIIQIQLIVLYQSTNILISNISNPCDVTAYNIAYKYLSVVLMVLNIFLSPLWPAFTDAYTKKDFTWMKNVYRQMVKLYKILVVVIIVMTALSPAVYKIWVGDSEIVSLNMTIAVSVYIMVLSWNTFHTILINGIGHVTVQTCANIFGMCLHIPLSFFLSHYINSIGVIVSLITINLIYAIIFSFQLKKELSNTASGVWCK